MALILLIEDNPSCRTSIREMLNQWGHDVEVLPDGRRALERCRARSFDIVITDLIMPGQEGIETIQRLRRAGIDVHIIAISDEGHHAQGVCYLQTARLLGADDTFMKPLEADSVCATLDCLLGTDDAPTASGSRPRSAKAPRLPASSPSERGDLPREERPPRSARRLLSR
jgi:DNA-binding response OmpR family regulator